MDRLDRLRLFVAVAEHASFAKAARSSRVSPTKVTRAIASLEAELGVPLLRRTTRHVALTDAGSRYLEHCRHALAELDEAARGLRGAGDEPRGRLVLGAPAMFGRLLVLPIVAELLARHPALNVELVLTDRVVHLLEEGIDAAIRIADLADSRLTALRLRTVRRVLVAATGYLARRGPLQTPADLAAHDLIALDAFAPGDEWRFAGAERPAVRLAPRLRVNDMAAAIAAAEADLGITRAFCYQVEEQVAQGRLVTLLDAYAPAPVPVSVLFLPHRQRSPALRAFVDLARERLRAG